MNSILSGSGGHGRVRILVGARVGIQSGTSKFCVQGSGVDADEGNDNNETASGRAGAGNEVAKRGRRRQII